MLSSSLTKKNTENIASWRPGATNISNNYNKKTLYFINKDIRTKLSYKKKLKNKYKIALLDKNIKQLKVRRKQVLNKMRLVTKAISKVTRKSMKLLNKRILRNVLSSFRTRYNLNSKRLKVKKMSLNSKPNKLLKKIKAKLKVHKKIRVKKSSC